ncbi:MAG: hypothetical protein AAGG75_26520 [Bacteroidota bacterium]
MHKHSTAQYLGQDASYEESGQMPFGLLRCDPHQAHALRQIVHKARTQVEGLSGSGKTFLLNQLLSQAMSQGQRCLVICGEASSFTQIRQRLAQFSLEHLIGEIGSSADEQERMLKHLRQRRSEADNPLPFNAEVYQQTQRLCQREYKRLEQYFRAMNQPSFGPYDWTETIGLYMRSSRKASKALLNSQLNPQDFTFDYASYKQLKKSIPESHRLYQPINTLKHPLSKLHHSFFTAHSKAESLEQGRQKLEDFIKKTAALHLRFITKLDDYAEKLEEHYEQHYQELSQLINKINEDLEDYRSRFGPEFEESSLMSTSRLHVYGVFFTRQKEILRAKSSINEDFIRLKKIHTAYAYFDYNFPAIDTRNIKTLQEQLENFRQQTEEWRAQLPAITQEELQRLSSKTVHPSLDFHDQIEALEYDLDILVEEINDSQLYEQAFVNHMLTIPKRQQLLEDMLERLKNTHFHLREHSAFFDWQRHWLTQPEHGRKLIAALIKVKPESWLAAFESWFLHRCLSRYQKYILPYKADTFDRYIQAWQQLQELMPGQIINHWQRALKDYARQLRRTDRRQYRLFFGRQQAQEPIALQQHTRLIAECHPVVFLKGPVAAHQLNMLLPHFDYLLIDDGHLLPPSSLDPLLQSAKQIVYFTQPLSLRQLELAARLEEGSFDRIQLKHQHKDTAGHLQLSVTSRLTDQSIFMQELALALGPYVDVQRLDFSASLDHQQLPLVIKSSEPGLPAIVIQIDDFFNVASHNSFLWEQDLRDRLAQQGYERLSTATINWWKDPRLEERRLATRLLALDSSGGEE